MDAQIRNKDDHHAKSHRSIRSPPVTNSRSRPLRLNELWKELPDKTRRDILVTLARLLAQRLDTPLAEPEVTHEDR
jgi:hypothetical protein